ncbi:hypothetical protein [Nonlabens tegetincola]|uniref:hypothetical protein n=1 Tax=Nonlabens tegetincola TaxID=323273 RepID=UPI000CF4DC3F|nr:hypothetical protein [Nonlabens tegetincola]PQJ19280.1 hypothetical protein BST93_05860 [Nonlabens tegetincola]
MKKRHQQKLVILSIALVIFLNVPILWIFNYSDSILGVPILYAYIFFVWLVSIFITYLIVKRYA